MFGFLRLLFFSHAFTFYVVFNLGVVGFAFYIIIVIVLLLANICFAALFLWLFSPPVLAVLCFQFNSIRFNSIQFGLFRFISGHVDESPYGHGVRGPCCSSAGRVLVAF